MRPSRKFLRLLTLLSFVAAALGSLGFGVILLSILGFVGAGKERSRLLLLYFFINFLLVTGLFVLCYAAFFFQDALKSWVKHHWTANVLARLRQASCCTTDLFAVMNVAFTLLGTVLFIVGMVVKMHDEMTSGQKWIAIIFIVVGTFMVAISVLGIIGSRSKSRSLLLIYIIGLGSCLIALFVCAVSAFTFSDHIVSTYNAHTSSSLACDLTLSGCTNCTDVNTEIISCNGVMQTIDGYWVSCNSSTSDEASSLNGDCITGMTLLNDVNDQSHESNDIAQCGKCPEWSASDVQAYLQSTLHLLGLFAVVVCLFMIVGSASALVLRRSLAGYQTDSI
ncbi:Tetraspanin/Peripherin [Plasmopara halstedii]|uniref:Tetraspanin/Peripherin n=1 Tax=Plasmopara halstedii TaxID=4781 RepID=A0A0P1B8Q0_PLAHL|nr:Tetraspanin/Peripherin [Plasmopara halstedii]CEG50214.1 Tetraspanin/Peripherin [Plasmopara halstedii]|eukprot:XP_024586583.1 Tetraspanin/Peripherin [Plasmopara halstedii]